MKSELIMAESFRSPHPNRIAGGCSGGRPACRRWRHLAASLSQPVYNEAQYHRAEHPPLS
jgi:hypothetical protein